VQLNSHNSALSGGVALGRPSRPEGEPEAGRRRPGGGGGRLTRVPASGWLPQSCTDSMYAGWPCRG